MTEAPEIDEPPDSAATMASRLDAVARYLTPRPDSFWRWGEEGKAVEWTDGTTIAFAAELADLFHRLPAAGIPPLDAIVLVIAACRDSWRDGASRLDGLSNASEASGVAFSTLLPKLDLVNALPKDLRGGRGLAVLLEVAFESYPHSYFTPETVPVLVETLRWSDVRSLTERRDTYQSPFGPIVRRLAAALENVSETRVRLRLATGLDEVPELPEDEHQDDTPPTLRQLLAELVDDPDLGGLARIARNLAAAVHLPRSLGDPDDQPLGGVSDLTNRGEFDKLLLSELAADDDVLAVRVAMNEALYLRREAPPASPPRRRLVLLDTGLRTWGQPRLMIAAAAAAMVAADEDTTVTFRPFAAGARRVDLTTRDGLLDQLAALDTHAHPGGFLSGWASHHEADDDAVLLTTRDTLADERFTAALETSDLQPLFLGVVDRSGRFELLARTDFGLRSIRTVQLDLDRLLTGPVPESPGGTDTTDQPLPAVLSQKPSPLRVASGLVEGTQIFGSDRGVGGERSSFCEGVTNARQWCRFRYGEPVGRILAESVPSSALLMSELRYEHGGAPLGPIVVFDTGNGYPALMRPGFWKSDGPSTRKLIGGGGRAIGACRVGPEHVALIRSGSVDIYRIEDGSHEQSLLTQGELYWRGGRFYRSADGLWHALHRTPHGGQFDVILDEASLKKKWGRLLKLIDLPESPPLAVLEHGIYETESETFTGVWPPEFEIGSVVPIDCAGAKLFVHGVAPNKRRPFGADTFEKVYVPKNPSQGEHARLVDPLDIEHDWVPRDWSVKPRSVRRRFDRFAEIDGEIALRSPIGHWVLIRPDRGSADRVRFVPSNRSPTEPVDLQPCPPPDGVGYTLKTTSWRGGRVWLDSRGMLHLRPGVADRPELTIYLDNKSLSVQVHGGPEQTHAAGPYFLDSAASVRDLLDEHVRPFASGE